MKGQLRVPIGNAFGLSCQCEPSFAAMRIMGGRAESLASPPTSLRSVSAFGQRSETVRNEMTSMPSYCPARMASISAIGSRSMGPRVSTKARSMVQLKRSGAV